MPDYQISAVDASVNIGGMSTITDRDLKRGVVVYRDWVVNELEYGSAERGKAGDDLKELLTRWGAIDPDWVAKHGFRVTLCFKPERIPQERRREFYYELESLYGGELPDIEGGGESHYPSDTFILRALKAREDVNHGDKVKAAIANCVQGEAYRDDDGNLRYKPGHLRDDFPELTKGADWQQIIREMARAMGKQPSDFAQEIADEIKEPIPGCFRITSNKPPIAIPSLSQVLATTPKPTFLVAGLIPDRRVTLAHGTTDAGKTYWSLEIAAAVAAGRPAFGHFQINRPGRVVFFAGEDPDDVWHGRLAALQETYGPLDGKFVPVSWALPLADPAALDRNRDMLRRLATEQPISLIVNDTLRRSVGDLDLNRGEVATPAIMALERIAQEFGCAVVTTAHAPKGNAAEIAGSQDLENLAPNTLLIKGRRDRGQLVAVETRHGDKKRVGPPIVPFVVDCRPVELEDGGRNLILVNYREKAAKAEPEPYTLAEDGAASMAPAPGSNGDGRRAEVIERYERGESRRKIARELHCRPELVQSIIDDWKRANGATL